MLLSSFLILSFQIILVNSHGILWEPIGRGSAWRKNFNTLKNFDDEGLYCGGFKSFWEINHGKCGLCGDAFEGPRNHEINGIYVTQPPTIVQTYEQGDIVDVIVNITANHGGFFIFQLCPIIYDEIETEHCFNNNNLEIVRNDNFEFDINLLTNIKAKKLIKNFESFNELNSNSVDEENYNDKERYNLFNPVDLNDLTYEKFKFHVNFEKPKSYTIKIKLPNDINCKRCVFRWIYVAGNSWGWCDEKKRIEKLGCGQQEQFVNCADISIH